MDPSENTWWLKFKDEAISALAKLVVWGGGILLTWAVFYAFIGKHEMEKVSESLNVRVTNESNDSVKRDAELHFKIVELEEMIKELYKRNSNGRGPSVKPPKVAPKRDDYYEKHYKEHIPIQQQQMMPPPASR